MTTLESFNQFIIVFKSTIGHHSLYEITNNNGLNLIEYATSLVSCDQEYNVTL